MKKLLIALPLTLLAFHVSANEVSDMEFCDMTAQLAEKVMQMRHSQNDLSMALKSAGDNEMHKSLVLMAYEQPHYNADVVVRNQVKDFKNDAHMLCLKAKGVIK
ncbi:hypothetical protein [Vibrio coralliilyticus]|uniref:hypothetical protein n=1 Tax=Vibrio coralliilyticus TaxID=190893 RepID=UPI00148D0446|nr:hypothetical protein [Vibrio coralliilyticus]NOI30196.1 hypothetical protein [Vibrio coralliilyticus]NOI46830.1 hypothetical protein [Vibrio coralliilyticus]